MDSKPKKGRKPGSKDSKPRTRTPSVLTEALIEDISALISKGNFRFFVCGKLGIAKPTFNDWISSGTRQLKEVAEGKRKEEDLNLMALLVQEVEKAEAEAHDKILSNIIDSKDIKALQWFLERRYPKLYRTYPQRRIDDDEMIEEDVDAVSLLADKLKSILNK